MPEQTEQWLEELLKLNDADDKVTDKQLRILKAAVEVFAEKGYAASSTSEIAQKAGVAEGTIFRHYKTKKELLLSIVAPTMSKLIAPFVLRNFNPVLQSSYDTFEEFLRALMRNRIEFVQKYQPMLRIMLQEIPFHPELQEPFQEHVMNKVAERMQGIVEQFQTRGQIVAMPPLSVMRMSASVLIGFVISRFFLASGQKMNEEQEIEYCIDFIMHGLSLRE